MRDAVRSPSRAARGRAVLAAALLGALALPAGAGAAPSLVPVGTFEAPVHVAAAPGDVSRLAIVERAGRVLMLLSGEDRARTFLDVRDAVDSDGEGGLLSIAFAPDYERTGLFYVYLTDADGDIRIEEFRRSERDPSAADPGSQRLVLEIPHPGFRNHFGGQLAFGPDDMLYAGPGDGGGAGDPNRNGQNLATALGKLLRIDPRAQPGGQPYRIPPDNPFIGRLGARGEIWAYGLRNPWRFSFDRANGDLVIADVGQGEHEEIDFAPRTAGLGKGANYGWSCFEGSERFRTPCDAPGHVPPVLEEQHSAGWCSITGGVVVRDATLDTLAGRYVYGDLCQQRVHAADLGARTRQATSLRVPSLVSFGEDACGRVYAASLEGTVSRIQDGAVKNCGAPPPGVASRLPSFSARVATSQRLGRGGSVAFRVRCSAPCRLSAAGDLRVGARRVAKLGALSRSIAPGRFVTLRMKPTSAGRRAAERELRRGRALRMVVRTTATDPDGERRRATLRSRIRR